MERLACYAIPLQATQNNRENISILPSAAIGNAGGCSWETPAAGPQYQDTSERQIIPSGFQKNLTRSWFWRSRGLKAGNRMCGVDLREHCQDYVSGAALPGGQPCCASTPKSQRQIQRLAPVKGAATKARALPGSA